MEELSLIKERQSPGTPLFLFECRISAEEVFYWSTHDAVVDGCQYEARVLDHSALEHRTIAGDESAFVPRITILLANADQTLSSVTSNQLWKGAEITIRFVVYDLVQDEQACQSVVMLRGTVNAPDVADQKSIRLSVVNRLGAYRSHLPTLRVQKRCPWLFPRTVEERMLAAGSGGPARYSPFFGCGYSPDASNGVGSVSASGPFASCSYTKADCIERGMYDLDSEQRETRRFAGFQYVPVSRFVRGYGDKGVSVSTPYVQDGAGADIVPLAYGTVWTDGLVTVAQSDGNLHRIEVVLCSGPIAGVIKVLVEDVEIPRGIQGRDMTATGWYNLVSHGGRNGSFNLDFADSEGNPAGDPNGGIAVLSIAVPNSMVGRAGVPKVQALVQGIILPTYDVTGSYLGDSFTSNSAWVLLDVLRRSGYREEEIDLASFAQAAGKCDELLSSQDSTGNVVVAARGECNVLLRTARPVADVIRGIQIGSDLTLRYGVTGKLELLVEGALAEQQTDLPLGSNATAPLSGGWPAYEFGDGTAGAFGVLVTQRGEPSLRLFSRSHAETANRLTLEFTDPINDHISDTYSLVDVDDVIRVGQEVRSKLPAVGVTGQAQAFRVCRKVLTKNLRGNLYAEFESTVKAIFLRPGDIITLNVESAGMLRSPFRVLSVAPSFNGEQVRISAQVHDDGWYIGQETEVQTLGGGCGSCSSGEPRPLLGDTVDEDDQPVHSIVEQSAENADGSQEVRLSIGFLVPSGGGPSLGTRPLVSVVPEIQVSGGTINGPRNLYYAISETNVAGQESQLSSTVHAFVPSGVLNASVVLRGIRTTTGALSLNVYRGHDPWQIRRIASGVALTGSWTDLGAASQPLGPPDPHFARARFEWRSEYLPPVAVSSAGATNLVISGGNLTPGTLKNRILRVHAGTGAGQERVIVDNGPADITISPKWNVVPDGSSTICVADAGWNTGGESVTSPVTFQVPNHSGSVIQIRGYGVNGSGVQSRKELSSLVRHTIDGAAGSNHDVDVPPAPTFGLATGTGGYLELGGIGFADLTNVSSISSGTLQIHYLDELNLHEAGTLTEDMTASSETLKYSPASTMAAGSLLQLEGELVRVVDSFAGSIECSVERGAYGTSPTGHLAATPFVRLEQRIVTIPIPRDFFGSPASGDFLYSIPMANSRVVAANLLFTNSKGNSEAAQQTFLELTGGGLRVLSGGQISIQVGGFLAIQSPAAPPILVEGNRAIRDIFAVVQEVPVGAAVVMRLIRGTEDLCELTIPAGSTTSNTVLGTSLPPLLALDEISLNILSVGQGPSTTPGRDLTVTIRL